jgi:hypothetical protein
LVLSCCKNNSEPEARAQPKTTVKKETAAPCITSEDDAREVLFTHLMEGSQDLICCLAIEGKDPPDSFMKRFVRNTRIKKLSGCTSKGMVKDKITEKDGVIFGIGSIVRLDESEITIETSGSRGPLHAIGQKYTLRIVGCGWNVIKEETLWIS